MWASSLALFAAAMWFAWLGWDHSYYDVHGVAQGPYRAWQVVGCGVTISAATVLAYLRAQHPAAVRLLAAAATIGFAVPWSIDASDDQTGMWGVGLLFLLVGGFVGLAALLGIIAAIANPRSSSALAVTCCCVLAAVALLFYPVATLIPLLAAACILLRHRLLARRLE